MNREKLGAIGDKLKEFDAFAEHYRFRLPEGKTSYQSWKGLFCTIIVIVSLLFYGTLQSIKLISFDETDVMVSSRDSFFDADFIYKQNLWFAFGITAYDSNQEPIEDPSYGLLEPYYKEWGLGGSGARFSPIPYRNCTQEELHIHGQSDSSSKFFKPHPIAKPDLEFYYKKLKCVDADHVEVQGDYNSYKARQFSILFTKCDNSTFEGTCKSDEEILSWLRRKFIFISLNQQRFSTRDFDENSKLVNEMRTVWVPVNTQLREEVVFKVQLTDLYLQDTYYQFSDLTEDVRRIFSNKYQMNRPYEFPDRVHVQISFEFDLNLYRVDRDVYSVLDWVGDMGGLNEGLYLGMKVILTFFQFYEFDHYLIERLYSQKNSGRIGQSRVFATDGTSWFRQRFNDFCCCCRRLFKLSRQERLFEKARKQMNAELDIVQFMKKIRRLETQNKKLKELNKLDLDDEKSEMRNIEHDFTSENGSTDYGFIRGKTARGNVSAKDQIVEVSLESQDISKSGQPQQQPVRLDFVEQTSRSHTAVFDRDRLVGSQMSFDPRRRSIMFDRPRQKEKAEEQQMRELAESVIQHSSTRIADYDQDRKMFVLHTALNRTQTMRMGAGRDPGNSRRSELDTIQRPRFDSNPTSMLPAIEQRTPQHQRANDSDFVE